MLSCTSGLGRSGRAGSATENETSKSETSKHTSKLSNARLKEEFGSRDTPYMYTHTQVPTQFMVTLIYCKGGNASFPYPL